MFSHLSSALLRVPLSKLGRFVFLLPNTMSCFIHCNGSRFLVLIAKVSSRRHQPSGPKRIHLLSPTPDQLVGFNWKASLKECSHGKSCNPKSDDSCNFHDLSSEAYCRLHRLESRRERKPLRKIDFHSLFFHQY